jgi:hypothetical protein
MIPTEVKQYIRGYYGRPPAEIDSEIQKKAIGDETPLDCRPADMLEPELPAAREALKDIPHVPRDLVSYALYPQYALEFLERKAQRKSRGTMTPELEVALAVAILHMNGAGPGSLASAAGRTQTWSDAGRTELVDGRTVQYSPGKWDKSSSSWSTAGRKDIMHGRRRG